MSTKPLKSRADNYHIVLEVDPNPNGLPVLLMYFKNGQRTLHIEMFDIDGVETLVAELQKKLAEM